MNNKETATQIINKIGGKQNIVQAWHCITRLRFNLSDKSMANLDDLKKIDGVIGAQFQGEQLQVVIGNNVANVYNALMDIIGPISSSDNSSKKTEKVNIINAVFDTISGCFNPILPAIIGAGLLKGIMSLLTFIKLLDPTSSEYFVLNMISDAAFTFIPFLLAFSAAKKFKTNEYIAVSLAGILMYPAFAASEELSLKFLLLKIPVVNYASSVIPIILSVLLLSYVYRYLEKIIPNMLRLILTPLFALLITAPISLAIISPIGNYIGVYVADFFVHLFNVAGPIAGLLFAGFMPFIVMTGMHYAFFPVAFDSLGKLGYEFMLLPMNLANNLAQSGATLGVAFKTRDKELKSVSFSCALSAAFGITEPALYGVTLKLKKPLYCAMIGSGIGGAIFGYFNIKAFGFTLPGITALPTYLNESFPKNFTYACLGAALSFFISFILTLFVPFEEEHSDKSTDTTTVLKTNTTVEIVSPLSGKAMPLSSTDDEVFAAEIVGKGIAIIPSSNMVLAPFNGVVSMITSTKHAIGIVSNEGIELLIHVGINTVTMDGKGFNCYVKTGDKILKGQKLLDFNIELIKENNLSITSVVVVTNTPDLKDVISYSDKTVTAGNDLIIKTIS